MFVQNHGTTIKKHFENVLCLQGYVRVGGVVRDWSLITGRGGGGALQNGRGDM